MSIKLNIWQQTVCKSTLCLGIPLSLPNFFWRAFDISFFTSLTIIGLLSSFADQDFVIDAAFFASTSAISFAWMLAWPGTQQNSTLIDLFWRELMFFLISASNSVLVPMLFIMLSMAAWQSEWISTLKFVMFDDWTTKLTGNWFAYDNGFVRKATCIYDCCTTTWTRVSQCGAVCEDRESTGRKAAKVVLYWPGSQRLLGCRSNVTAP